MGLGKHGLIICICAESSGLERASMTALDGWPIDGIVHADENIRSNS